MKSISKIFAEGGTLQQVLPHFQPRQSQQRMAEAITDLKASQDTLVVEAETGTGKTFAYVAPALLKNGKTIISTGTKNLQEQLFHRDIPVLKEHLAPEKQVRLLKGRANYLCLHRQKQAQINPKEINPTVERQLKIVKRWSVGTKTGDLSELKGIPEHAEVIPFITSTQDNCLGKECPFYEDCYVFKARRQAQEADIVVVNHHLFFADAALRESGYGELIPDADLIVFDEAHQVLDIASTYFSRAISTGRLYSLCKDAQLICQIELKDAHIIVQSTDKLLQEIQAFRALFPETPGRFSLAQRQSIEELPVAYQNVYALIQNTLEACQLHKGRSQDLDVIIEKLDESIELFDLVMEAPQAGFCYWHETSKRAVSFHRTPIHVQDQFQRFMGEQKASWVFTSATLTVNQQFEYFTQRLGLQRVKTLMLESPFDYAKQALFCVPRYLPEPMDPKMRQTLIDIIEQVAVPNSGGTFVLFTSYRALNEAHEYFSKRPEKLQGKLLLVQGQQSKRELMKQFIEAEQAILLGTSSFWEGVDVAGQALSCVIIDKLPFSSPDDPLLQARMQDCQQQGKNPFMTIQIPEAIIAMKQGAGRLIRTVQDTGCLVVCDNRLVTRGYGQMFIKSLPSMRRTRSLSEVISFLTSTSKV